MNSDEDRSAHFDFRTALEELAEDLRQDPRIELCEFAIGPPVPEQALSDVEFRFGTPLPAPLRRFYRSLGSATLAWCFASRLDEEDRRHIAERDTYLIPDTGLFDGSIRIASLEDLLFDEEHAMLELDWDEGKEPEVEFAGTVYPDTEFSRLVRHFDTLDNYYAMSFVTRPDHGDWPMLFLGDHWIEVDHSRVTYLDDYLRYITTTRGLVTARTSLFSTYRGDREAPLRYSLDIATRACQTPAAP